MNFKALAASALVATTALIGAVAPSEARPSRLVGFETDMGTRVWYEPQGRNGVEVLVHNDYNGTGFQASRHCGSGQIRYWNNDGYTEDQIGYITQDACDW